MKKSLAVAVILAASVGMFAADANTSAGEVHLCSSEGNLSYILSVPEFSIVSTGSDETRIQMPGATYVQHPGYPRLPVLTYTFALPPASEVVEVEVSGARSRLSGTYNIEPALPALPLSADSDAMGEIFDAYQETKNRVYSGEESIPQALGEIRGKGELREYSLVTVGVYPFAYDPVSGKLSVTDEVTVNIRYAPVSDEHADFVSRFISKGTINPDVPSHVYNKSQARSWYAPSTRLLAEQRMIILTTQALEEFTDDYAFWRFSTGFEVEVVTVEDVTATAEGVDTPQKIRNYLRDNAADFDYLFIIGHYADIPMRVLTPFNNNDHPSYYDSDVTPNPSDIYYGDLSKSDDDSWDKDGDGYYGEAMNSSGFYNPQDDPDLGMELHVGRINNSFENTIPRILEKTWLFEYSDDDAYKKSSVLAGGILWYPNQNGSGYPGYDGAHYMEYVQTNGIIDPSHAYTLYEKAGDGPSDYACDEALTQENLKNALSDRGPGIFVENNHGWRNSFARCVWHDDGDGIPEEGMSGDLDWPIALESSDVSKLNDDSPNVAFLLSCLNGYPEAANSLAQSLLNFGSVAVVAHTRSALGRQGWSGPGSGGQNALYYYVLENYLKETTHDKVLGDAVDGGRLEYYNLEYGPSKFINTYSHVIFGDPALRHFGRAGTLPSNAVTETAPPVSGVKLAVDFKNVISFSIPVSGEVRLEVWDASGRRVQTLYEGSPSAGTQTLSWDTSKLASGSYFITLRTEAAVKTAKAVVIK